MSNLFTATTCSTVSVLHCLFFILLLGTPQSLFCALKQYQNDAYQPSLKEIKSGVDVLRHEVSNHETELRMFDERINNQEATLSSLRQMVLDAAQVNKELVKGSSTTFESKIAACETNNKNLIADIKQLKTHANETSAALLKIAQKVVDLDKMVALQTQNVQSMREAIASLMEAMQVSTPTKFISALPAESEKHYVIKAGDTLEKIAKAHNTTVKALREVNNLSTDRIVVGKVLLIP